MAQPSQNPVRLSSPSRSGSAGGDAGRASRRGGRRRAGRAVAGDRSGAARPARRAARRCRPDRRGLARDLLLKALAGISGTGSASASAWSTRAWCGASARSFTATRSSTSSICCRRRATSGPPSSTCSNFTPRPIWSIASQELPAIDLRWRNKVTALEQRNDHVAADDRDAGRALSDARRYRRRLRRRALVAAADGRRGVRRASVRGPVPDRRRQDDGGIPDRALVLVRSAVPCRPLRAAAQAARRYLAHRSAAHPRCRSRRREAAGERAAAHRAHARPRQVRVRMDLALQIPVPADGEVHPWPRDLCRRRRASGLAVRRARRQFRAWRMPRISPGSSIACCAETSPEALLESYHTERSAAADENIREFDPLDRFHGAGFASGGAAAQGGAVAGQGNRIRQAHDQWRAAVGAVGL